MKKIIIRIAIVFIVLILILLIASPLVISYYRGKATLHTFEMSSDERLKKATKIKWLENMKIGDVIFNKPAFSIPVQIEGIEAKNLFMQFDSGSPYSMLYGNKLKLLKKHIKMVQDSVEGDYVKNAKIHFGATTLSANKLPVKYIYKEKELDSTFIQIGTLGYDAFSDRTLILDFKNEEISITEKPAEDLGFSLNYIDSPSVDKFPLFFKAKINDKKVRLMYDTGSSLFPIITNSKKINEINPEIKIDTLCCAESWGKSEPIYRKQTDATVAIGGVNFKDQYFYASPRLDILNNVPGWLFYGITGNILFDDKIVVIDTKNNVFGIVKD